MSKKSRHIGRKIAIQALFQYDFQPCHPEPVEGTKIDNIIDYIVDEIEYNFEDKAFVKKITHGVLDNQSKIDAHIIKFAPEWPLDQITPIDRNILRVGIYELVFDLDIPAKVAIDEAIEMAREFSGESSRKFVNGVLGSIFKSINIKKKSEDKEK